MSQTVDQIVAEEQSAIELEKAALDAQAGQRVVVRLQGALQSVNDRIANLTAEKTELESEIEAREPKAEEASETPEQEQAEIQG
jgi:predicted  nucleic acid-binding Zn-ribbon protein